MYKIYKLSISKKSAKSCTVNNALNNQGEINIPAGL